MADHTPGPWSMEWSDGYLINGIIHVPDTYGEHHGDAYLCLHSPALLEACEKAERLLTDDDAGALTDDVIAHLRAAIALATQEEG